MHPEPSPTDPHERLGAALRQLSDVVVRSAADPAELDEAAARIEALCDRLSPVQRARPHDNPFHPMSLVGGRAHPAAPQLHMARDPDGGAAGVAGAVRGTVRLGPTYEGGPGLVHGGVLALLVDHAMGQALFLSGHRAMTVSLQLRYRAPTPLGVELTVRAGLERVEGRKLHVSAEVAVGDTVSVSATAVFLELTAANVRELFAPERLPRG